MTPDSPPSVAPPLPVEPPKKTPVLTIVFVVLGAAAGSYLAGLFTPLGKASMPDVMSTVYVEANRSLPRMMDEFTRLESICPDTLDGKTLIYKYTLVGLDLSKLDMTQVKAAVHADLIKNYKTSKEMANFRNLSVILKYQYFDVKCGKIMEFTVDPKTF